MKTLKFSDTDSFYKELKKAVKQGESFTVSTEFRSIDQMPKKLQRVLNAKQISGSIFCSNMVCHSSFNWSYLLIIASTAAGAKIGLIGGPKGAAIGAIIGFAAGVTGVAFHKNRTVIWRFDKEGRIEIEIGGSDSPK